jgi:hypothetical protein
MIVTGIAAGDIEAAAGPLLGGEAVLVQASSDPFIATRILIAVPCRGTEQ